MQRLEKQHDADDNFWRQQPRHYAQVAPRLSLEFTLGLGEDVHAWLSFGAAQCNRPAAFIAVSPEETAQRLNKGMRLDDMCTHTFPNECKNAAVGERATLAQDVQAERLQTCVEKRRWRGRIGRARPKTLGD